MLKSYPHFHNFVYKYINIYQTNYLLTLKILNDIMLLMRTTEKQELKKNIKRLGLFLLIVFLPVCLVCATLFYLNVPQGANIAILVVLLFILFFIYLWICGKIDQRKAERLKKKKDPFSD